MDNVTAKKSLCKTMCLPSMRTDRQYKVMIILSHQGDILQANCQCPSGKGPTASCKHIAALAYAIEDFVRLFVRDESGILSTDQLQIWNRPRPAKIAPAPTYEISLEKKTW